MVVGASSEIGGAIAHRLEDLGWSLDVWGRDRAALAPRFPAAAVHEVDLRDRAAVEEALATCAPPLTTVVHAAGVFDWCDAEEADLDTWDEVFDVNLSSAARLSRLALPWLLRSAPSSLVLIGSTAAHQAFPHNAAYVASKHGLTGLAGAVRAEVGARGVAVTIVNPGMVASGAALGSDRGRTRPESLLRPGDVAAAVAYAVCAPPHACISRIDLTAREP